MARNIVAIPFLFLLCAGAASATATYQYTASTSLYYLGGTYADGTYGVPGVFFFVTATVDFSSPLADNLYRQTETPVSFSITDNITTATSGLIHSIFSTDASGNITEWLFAASSGGITIATANPAAAFYVPSYGPLNGYDYSGEGTLGGGINVGIAGSWSLTSVTSDTPEPAAWSLVLGPLLVLGWRRGRSGRLWGNRKFLVSPTLTHGAPGGAWQGLDPRQNG